MIVVKVELWPGGDARRAKRIGAATITNESELADISNYAFDVTEDASAIVRKPLDCGGMVIGHDRRESVWRLIRKVLNVAIPWQEGDDT